MSNPNIRSDASWRSAPVAVVDLEGNGRQPPDLVELGVICVDDGVPGAPKTWLVRPEQPISARVTRIHGIKNKDVAKSPSFDAIKAEVEAALQGRYLVAHNAAVDWDVLHRKLPVFEPLGIIDTLRLARALHPGLTSYKLAELLDAFHLREVLATTPGMPHRAGYDAAAALHLLLHLVEHSPRGILSFGDLLTLGELPSTFNDPQRSLF